MISSTKFLLAIQGKENFTKIFENDSIIQDFKKGRKGRINLRVQQERGRRVDKDKKRLRKRRERTRRDEKKDRESCKKERDISIFIVRVLAEEI